jgi:hypothetical protein
MGYSQVIHRLSDVVPASGGETKNRGPAAQEKSRESGGKIFMAADDFL